MEQVMKMTAQMVTGAMVEVLEETIKDAFIEVFVESDG
jgi:deoxyhypusine synthase